MSRIKQHIHGCPFATDSQISTNVSASDTAIKDKNITSWIILPCQKPRSIRKASLVFRKAFFSLNLNLMETIWTNHSPYTAPVVFLVRSAYRVGLSDIKIFVCTHKSQRPKPLQDSSRQNRDDIQNTPLQSETRIGVNRTAVRHATKRIMRSLEKRVTNQIRQDWLRFQIFLEMITLADGSWGENIMTLSTKYPPTKARYS